jgi:hypothetical protein
MSDLAEAIKRVRAVMPERFGSPEALADPVRTARWEKSCDEMAERYARAALGLEDIGRAG